jgi:hypothetical protein
MKYTLTLDPAHSYWNGAKPLPAEINVLHYHPQMAEFELLSIICTLHGFVTAFDILTGAETETEKDADITSVLTAFQHYISPKMPLSHYTGADKRTKPIGDKKVVPIDSNRV